MAVAIKFKDWNHLYESFPYKDYYTSNLEIDSIVSGTTKRYAVVYTKTGEKSSSGRDLYKENPSYYLRTKSGYEKVTNPYNKN